MTAIGSAYVEQIPLPGAPDETARRYRDALIAIYEHFDRGEITQAFCVAHKALTGDILAAHNETGGRPVDTAAAHDPQEDDPVSVTTIPAPPAANERRDMVLDSHFGEKPTLRVNATPGASFTTIGLDHYWTHFSLSLTREELAAFGGKIFAVLAATEQS